MKLTCALCQENIDIEDDAVIEINPETMRRATMHPDCLAAAIDEMTPERRSQWNEIIQD